MEIAELKQYLKSHGMTYKDLAEKCNVPESTLKNLFSGATKHPRIDTMQAIERALGITPNPNLSAEQQELFSLIQSLSDDEVKAMNDYLTYLLSKRK